MKRQLWALGVFTAMVGGSEPTPAGVQPGPPPVHVVAPSAVAGKLEPDDLPPPQPEVVPQGSPVDLPAIPDFRLAPVEPGFHAPRELEVHGRALLGTQIRVKGYVTWIYDCTAAIKNANPEATAVQIHQAIEDDPALCEYPKLYLGDAPDTPRSASIWIVDMPRTQTPAERATLARDDARSWAALSRLAVGDYVTVTGTWATQSPHAEHNSGGLVLYKAIELATPAAPTTPTSPTSVLASAAPAQAAKLPDIAVAATPPLRPAVDDDLRDISVGHLNACNQALAAHRYDAALAACQAALRAWEGNHLAWYATAGAHMAKGEWREARAAAERAVTLRPDLAMYQLYHGMALYEAARLEAREAAALQLHKKLDAVTIDPATLALDDARDALRRAARLSPELWRAHYYLGRVYRDRDEARPAAAELSQTIKTNPGYRAAYVALVELYRRWGYVDESLVVATVGTIHVAPADAADLWIEIATAYDAKSADDKAIAALGKALAIRPGDPLAKLERGRIYFRKGDLVSARRDLQDVVQSASPAIDVARRLATEMLAQLASRAAEGSARQLCTDKRACRVIAAPYSGFARSEEPWARM